MHHALLNTHQKLPPPHGCTIKTNKTKSLANFNNADVYTVLMLDKLGSKEALVYQKNQLAAAAAGIRYSHHNLYPLINAVLYYVTMKGH